MDFPGQAHRPSVDHPCCAAHEPGPGHAVQRLRRQLRPRARTARQHRRRACGDVDSRERAAALPQSHRAAAVCLRRHPADRRRRLRHDRQRRATLDQPRLHPDPAFRADEDRAATDAGVVLRPLRSHPAPAQFRGRYGAGAGAGAVDRKTARSRHGAAGGCCRILRAVPRRIVVEAPRGARPGRVRQPAFPVVDDARLPAPACTDAARSLAGSARRRLSHHPVHHCAGVRRIHGQGLAQRHSVTPGLSPGAHHRFHFRRLCRRVRPRRQRGAHGAVPAGHRARIGDRRQCADPVHATAGWRDHADVLYLCVCEHGNGRRHPAGGRRSAAADQLRRHLVGDHTVRHRVADEHPYA